MVSRGVKRIAKIGDVGSVRDPLKLVCEGTQHSPTLRTTRRMGHPATSSHDLWGCSYRGEKLWATRHPRTSSDDLPAARTAESMRGPPTFMWCVCSTGWQDCD